MPKNCCLPSCRAQADSGPGKSGGFFLLPSLEKFPYRRQEVVQGAGLSEAYMLRNGDFRICFRHYKRSDFITSGKQLTLKRGIVLFTNKSSVSPAPNLDNLNKIVLDLSIIIRYSFSL